MSQTANAEVARSAARPAPRAYAHALDGLRALCALAVVGYHMGFRWIEGGFHGVTVLFVLSGYLATAGLIREFRRSHGHIDLVGYWTRRVRRTYPTTIVFILVCLAVCGLLNHVMLTKMRPDIIPALLNYLNWSKIFRAESYFAQAGSPSPLTHFWTLAIEWQFYLIWPPILYLLLRTRLKKRYLQIGLLVLALVSAGLMAWLYVPDADPSRAYYGTDARIHSLLLGCFLALFWPFFGTVGKRVDQLPPRYASLINPLGAVSLIALIALMLFTKGYTAFSYWGGTLLVSVLSMFAIAACTPADTWLARVLSLRPLTWIGERSYAIYLWHYPIIEWMTKRNAAVVTPWWHYVAMLAVTLVVAELSYRLIELPLRSTPLLEAIGLRAPRSERLESAAAPADRRETTELPRVASPAGARTAAEVPHTRQGGSGRGPWFVATRALYGVTLLAVTGCALWALIFVPPVNALGDAADEKRVSQASLRKPLRDGVYDVVFLGDSVSLGANKQLTAAFPHGLVDAEGSREAEPTLERFQEYLDQGVVGDTVVFHVGTNGLLDDEIMEKIVAAVGPERTLWLVNDRVPDNRCEPNNQAIQNAVDAHDNVHLIDWYSATEGHSEYLDSDGIHLTYEGRDAYAQLVVDTMGYVRPNDANTRYDVVLLGDAAALSAADQLAAAFPHGVVDCAKGRDPQKLAEAFQDYLDAKVAGDDVVVCVGSDEPVDQSALDALVAAIGGERRVWLVNVRVASDWCQEVNAALAACAQANDNVSLVDWYAASEGHADWMGENGTDLTEAGAQAYADLIVRTMAYDPNAAQAHAQDFEATGTAVLSDGEGN